jgi:hypothetical protein
VGKEFLGRLEPPGLFLCKGGDGLGRAGRRVVLSMEGRDFARCKAQRDSLFLRNEIFVSLTVVKNAEIIRLAVLQNSAKW